MRRDPASNGQCVRCCILSLHVNDSPAFTLRVGLFLLGFCFLRIRLPLVFLFDLLLLALCERGRPDELLLHLRFRHHVDWSSELAMRNDNESGEK